MTSPPKVTAERVDDIRDLAQRVIAVDGPSILGIGLACEVPYILDWVEAAVPFLRIAAHGGNGGFCFCCDWDEITRGHAPDCAIAALLAGFPAPQP